MNSAAEDNNGKAFEGFWAYEDGVITQNGTPVILLPTPSTFLEKIGRQVAAFCQQAKRFWIQWDHLTYKGVPRMFLSLTEDELRLSSGYAQTVLTVEVQREDGQIARAALTIGRNDLNGLFATLTCQKKNDDPERTLKMNYVDWDKVGK